MRKLMNWAVGTQGDWSDSGLALPSLDVDADAGLQRWCVVAGGLALILSRVADAERAARFAHTHVLYVQVRRRLRQAQPVDASPELIGEVMHEVADVADPHTRTCLKACFHAAVREPSVALASVRAGESARSSPSSSQQRSGGDAAGASLTSVMLLERSAVLRRKLAEARGTGFAELK